MDYQDLVLKKKGKTKEELEGKREEGRKGGMERREGRKRKSHRNREKEPLFYNGGTLDFGSEHGVLLRHCGSWHPWSSVGDNCHHQMLRVGWGVAGGGMFFSFPQLEVLIKVLPLP